MPDELRVQKTCKRELTAIVKEISGILGEFAAKIVKRNPKAEERVTVLLGALLKASESARAILILGNSGFVDEMNVLMRTMVELVINAAYLQYARDAEFKRFLHHDAISGHIAMLDFSRATQGNAEFDLGTAMRVTKNATAAANASGLSLTDRQWNVETRTLKQRADVIDEEMGQALFAELLASIYVTGSGYTHGSFKTIHKHAYYLTTGTREHPLVTMFGECNSIFGVGYILDVFGRYLGFRFKLPTKRLKALAVESRRLSGISLEDLRIHRKGNSSVAP
jgi:Family of unknown function (DUF5677)